MSGLSGFPARFERFERFGRFFGKAAQSAQILPKNRPKTAYFLNFEVFYSTIMIFGLGPKWL